MRFILLTRDIPAPPDQGSKIRNLMFLKSLSRLGDVYLVSLCTQLPSPEDLRELRKYCRDISFFPNRRTLRRKLRDVFRSLSGIYPYLVLANTHEGVRRKLEELTSAEERSILQISELCVANNLPRTLPQRRFIFDAHNVEGLVQERISKLSRSPIAKIYYALQAKKTISFEQKIVRAAETVLAVSKDDENYFTAFAKKTACIANGLELIDEPQKPRGDVLIFTGTLQYEPNSDGLRWFLDEIWPRVSAALPELRFEVIARKPSARFLSFASARVSFLSEVEDIVPHLDQARLMVVPLRAGGGTRFKVLQAFNHRLPVVSTSIGAEGIDVQNGKHLLLADTAEAFADAVIKVVRNPQESETLAQAAQELVRSHYDWEKIFPKCEAIYEALPK